ncbi:unnamed protein product [Macrosiphum euphorbiae]|uniref:Trehalase n=1 Tax=Macrosiphum euphorbiae TaxID=13131 RepID=A0AAV0X5W4_9HEMI|nr:unnamed protein product [Macrosiphum euphorbiae]
MNNTVKASKYENISMQWTEAVTVVLWDEEVGAWLDHDMFNKKKRNNSFPTSIPPLMPGATKTANFCIKGSELFE